MARSRKIIFQINGEDYGMDISRVNTIIRRQTVIPIPFAMPCVEGIINTRGSVVPVYSLYKKFGLEIPQIGLTTKWILTTVSGLQVAFQVDTVNEIIEVDDQSIQEQPVIAKNIDTDYIQNVIRIKEKLVIMLDVDKLLSLKERQNVDTIMKEYKK